MSLASDSLAHLRCFSGVADIVLNCEFYSVGILASDNYGIARFPLRPETEIVAYAKQIDPTSLIRYYAHLLSAYKGVENGGPRRPFAHCLE